jgi:hypothetical protein
VDELHWWLRGLGGNMALAAQACMTWAALGDIHYTDLL